MIGELKEEQSLKANIKHWQVKYPNNPLEADHGKFKIFIKPVRGFQSTKMVFVTIKGFKVMRLFRKGQFNARLYGCRTEVSFINELFGIYS